MASDDVDDLFASDDDDGNRQENGVNYDDEPQQDDEEDDVNALFDDDVEENIDEQAAPARDGGVSDDQEAGGSDGEKSEEEEPARPRKVMAPPIDISAPLVPLPPSDKTYVMKTSNIIDFESRPFDPDTFQAEEEVYQDEYGIKRIRLRDQNVVRWRWHKTPNGRMERESNARFVKWSDGSWQLLLGDEVLDVAKLDMTRDHAYLYVLHGGTLQGQAQLCSKLQCRPASLDSRSHKRLREMVEKKHSKVYRVGHHVTLADPEKDKLSKEKTAWEAIKNREVVARKQERTAAQYSQRQPTYQRSALTVQDLEQPDDDDLMGYATPAPPSHLRRTYDDEGEGARKLMAAQHSQPSQHKHRRTIDDDDDEREEEEEGDYEEEDEGNARKKSRTGSFYGSQERERPREKEKPKDKNKPKAKRGVVMSSDEDD